MSETSTDIISCCTAVNPCEAKCMIENALVNQAVGKTVMSYKVGEETFSIKLPSISDLRSLLDHYTAACNAACGVPSRPRANVSLVYGSTCSGRTASSCRGNR